MNFNFIEAGERGVPIKAWTKGVQVEDKAMQQVRNLASLPFAFKHIAIMPDVHWGMGATVGSVIATKGAIVPAAVGVDLGCGMIAAKLSIRAEDLPDGLHGIRTAIESAVPHGRTDNGGPNDRGAWGAAPERVVDNVSACLADDRFARIMERNPDALPRTERTIINQLCTLGTGNHFIELCVGDDGHVWIMLHSGSRGVGNRIGTYFIEKAKKQAEQYGYASYLPDQDLAWLTERTPIFDDYIDALSWAQDYAALNRRMMLSAVQRAIEPLLPPFQIDGDVVNCHHNYAVRENHFGQNVWITRKGAVRARNGELGIIPGSMGTRSYIVRGLGNPESFTSCSHGAGRAMSRGEAKKRFTIADHAAATEGVECRKDVDVIDETPGAYKPIDAVIEAERDLIESMVELRGVVCVKG
jgi:tRNA-splicing ligase RtcB